MKFSSVSAGELIGTVPINGDTWQVFRVSRSSLMTLDTEGLCVHQERQILISDSVIVERFYSILGHEIIHAMLSESNAELVASVLGCEKEGAHDCEEAVAAFLGPKLGRILESFDPLGLFR